MSRPRIPSRRRIRRRRGAALAVLVGLGLTAVYLLLAPTVLAPVDEHGARTVGLTIHSRAVGEDLGVSVVVPADLADPRGKRPLLVFLHGRTGSDGTYRDDEAMYRGLAELG